MLTNNKTMAKQSFPEMNYSIPTSSDYGNGGINDDQSIASYDESFSDSGYDSSNFDDANMFDVGAFTAVQELVMQNTTPRVRMPQTYGSGGDLQAVGKQEAELRDFMIRRKSLETVPGFVMAIQTTSKPTETKQDKFGDHPMADVDPKVLLKSIIESYGVSSEPRPYASLKGFFATRTEVNVAAYDMETVSAIRKGVLDDVRKLHEAGKNLVACNKFGESIMHLACRHGKTDIVEFLMFEAGSSPRVICDVSSSAKLSYAVNSFQ
jgi:hypothetical protein